MGITSLIINIVNTKKIVLRTDNGSPSMSGIQISVHSASYSKGVTYKL